MTRGRAPQQGLEPRDCIVCGARFQPYRDFHVSCGERACRQQAKGLNPRRAAADIACKYCGRTFTAEWSGIGQAPPCPDCSVRRAKESQERKNIARNARYAEEPHRREANLAAGLAKNYGITLERFREMVDRQGNRCAICGDSPNPGGIKAASRLHVDHDHVTGTVRDLLCNRCNQGIGYFTDDPALFRAAAEYIERHRAS